MHTLIVVGDIHANSSVGVCPPDIELDDGQFYGRSKTQKWLWDCWIDFCEKVKKEKKGKLVVVVAGEVADAPYKYASHQYVSQDKFIAQDIGIRVLEPLANMADYLYITRGTEAHVGKSSGLDNAIAGDFTNIVKNPDTGQPSWYWLPLQIENVKCDIAHHTQMGNMGWTQRNYATYTASKILFECAEKGRDVPQLVFRQHVHRWADSYDNFDNIRCIIGGCWVGSTSHTNKIKPGALAEIGGTMTFIDNDKYEVTKIKYQPEMPKWSKIK